MITLCVLNYNDSFTTLKLLNHIYSFEIIDHIIVVDNNSSDSSYDILKSYEDEKITVIKTDVNGGYGYGNNVGILYAIERFHSSYVCICNPDILINEASLIICEKFLQSKSDTVIVAPMMKDRNGIKKVECAWPIQKGMRYLLFSLKLIGKFFNDLYPSILEEISPRKVDCVAGSCLLVNTEKFKLLGMYDENIFLYCEETVIGIKAKAKGYSTYLIRSAEFEHLHSESIDKSIKSKIKQKQIMWNSRLYVLKKYYKWNGIKMFFANFIKHISILEEYIFRLI